MPDSEPHDSERAAGSQHPDHSKNDGPSRPDSPSPDGLSHPTLLQKEIPLEQLQRITRDVNRQFSGYSTFRRKILSRFSILIAFLMVILAATYLIFRDMNRAKQGAKVSISLSRGGFHTVEMAIRVSGQGVVDLSDHPSSEMDRLPTFQGKSQKYGVLILGSEPPARYPFALDVPAEGSPRLYPDRNRNGDLRDDGAPLTNQGTGWFAASLSLPFRDIGGDVRIGSDYRTWVFTNSRFYDRSELRRYSQTQLTGTVVANDKAYAAWIADSGIQDGDFTNDGICLDLDGSGSVDYETECASDGTSMVIDGRRYLFRITW